MPTVLSRLAIAGATVDADQPVVQLPQAENDEWVEQTVEEFAKRLRRKDPVTAARVLTTLAPEFGLACGDKSDG